MTHPDTQREFDEARRILDKALDVLYRKALTPGYTMASRVPFDISLSPYLSRMLMETRAEYEPDERGRIPAVTCSHCWDNINLGRLIIGEPTEGYPWDEESDG